MSNRDDGMDLLIYDKLKEMNGEKQTEVSVSSFAKDAVSLFEFLGPLFVLVYIAICGFTGMTFSVDGLVTALATAGIISSFMLIYLIGFMIVWYGVIAGIVILITGGVLLFLYNLVMN